MSTNIETSHMIEGHATSSHGSEEPMPDISKEKWIRKYTSQMLGLWSQWQTPLGVARAYASQIKKDLAKFYDDPLKTLRVFVSRSRHKCSFGLNQRWMLWGFSNGRACAS